MLSYRPHPVRIGLAALCCLAVASPLFSAPRGRSERREERSAQREESTSKERPSRPATTSVRPAQEARATPPQQQARSGQLARPAPAIRARDPKPQPRVSTPSVWPRSQVRPVPVTTAPEQRPSRPDPAPNGNGWQARRGDNASLPRIYRVPEQQSAPESSARILRSQPAQPVVRPSPGAVYRPPDKQERAERPRTLYSQPARPVVRTQPERERTSPPSPVRVEGPRANLYQAPARQSWQTDERPQINREQLRTREGERTAAPDPPRGADRKYTTPRATFRGPEAERELRTIPLEAQARVSRQLYERLREQNRAAQRPHGARPSHDIVGNIVPDTARLIVPEKISRISVSHARIRRQFGTPHHNYFVLPRTREAYWDGYWDGYADGYWAGRRFRHTPAVVVYLYYPYYWSDPGWLAFRYPGYYPSVYHYWGWCPGWVHPTRVYYVPTEYVYVPATPYRYYYSGYAVDDLGAQRAIEDVRRAWFNSEVAPLARHLTDQLDIRVYFDGEYDYTTSTEDYYAMTVDAMASTQTVAMDFDQPIWISSHEVFYTGRHVFYDPTDARQTVYVSYRLRRLGAEWYVVAVGSSLRPIRHQYHDFRYS